MGTEEITILEISKVEKEHLIKAIRSSCLDDKGYLWDLLKKLEK